MVNILFSQPDMSKRNAFSSIDKEYGKETRKDVSCKHEKNFVDELRFISFSGRLTAHPPRKQTYANFYNTFHSHKRQEMLRASVQKEI